MCNLHTVCGCNYLENIHVLLKCNTKKIDTHIRNGCHTPLLSDLNSLVLMSATLRVSGIEGTVITTHILKIFL